MKLFPNLGIHFGILFLLGETSYNKKEGKVSAMFLLEFPQNLIGYFFFRKYTQGRKRPYYRYRDAYVVHVPGNWGAISLSRFIFADDRCYRSKLIRHEYGHSLQSKLLMPLYLPVIGLPSLLWNRLFKSYRRRHSKSYYDFYTEAWANRLGGYRERKRS